MKTKKPNLLHEDHPKPVTRRDFLSHGLIGTVGVAMMPTAFSFFSDQFRQVAYGDKDDGFIPFLVFDMAGGGGLPANFLVGNQGGPEDLISSYDQIGWDPRKVTLDKRFGLPMAGDDVSRILSGMLSVMSVEAQAGLQMASFCHRAQDDSRTNQISALIEVNRAGVTGKYIDQSVGMTSEITGANSSAPIATNQLRALEIKVVEDLSQSIGFGALEPYLSQDAIVSATKLALGLSEHQLSKMGELTHKEQVELLTKQSFSKNLKLSHQKLTMDPRLDEVFQQVYGLSQGSSSSSLESRTATIVSSVLKRQTGPGAIFISGCDYHDGTQQTGDNKDFETGEHIGRAVEVAYRLKKPLMFQLLTDGGVYAEPGTRLWRGDAGEKCMTVLGYFNPNQKPELIKPQVGHYTDGQGASGDTFIGNDPSKVSYAVLANYLKVCGKFELFEAAVSQRDFPRELLDEVLVFA